MKRTISKNLMMNAFKQFSVFLCVSMLASNIALARQLDDVALHDNVTLPGTETSLQLNGMGYRTKFVFDVYVGALYTESRVRSRDAAQALTGPKRIVMHMVYDEVSKEKMASAWNEGFEENNSEEALKGLQSRLATFINFFPDLKKDDIVLLDYIPGNGTHVTINGNEKGEIKGADFFTALLDVWLGDEPADDDLKEAMLGGDDD